MKLKTILTSCNLYIFGWILYVQQGLLYSSGSIISRMLLLILLLVSIMNMIEVNRHYYLPVFFKGLNVLLAMFTFYGVLFIITNQEGIIAGETKLNGFEYLKRILISILPIYSCYLYTQNGLLNRKNLMIWGVLFFISAYGQYLIGAQQSINYLIEIGSTRTEYTNNSGYIFLCLLPIICIYKKPLIQYVGLLILVYFVISSMKRGAILGTAIGFIVILYRNLMNADSTKKILMVFLSFVILVLVMNYLQDMMANSEYFMARLNNTLEGDSSGRDSMYRKLWDAFINEPNPLYILLGRGSFGSVFVIGNLAHNDWLEILTNQGILGIFIFIYFLICFYKSFTCLDKESTAYLMLLLGFLVFVYKTFMSMSYDDMPIYLSAVIGYALSESVIEQPEII